MTVVTRQWVNMMITTKMQEFTRIRVDLNNKYPLQYTYPYSGNNVAGEYIMSICTFFGHRDCPDSIRAKLQEVLVDLITNCEVEMFYVGHQGQFDIIVRGVLRDLKKEYPHINYAVFLAYMPEKHNNYIDYADTMLPEGIEAVHPRYAISWRNNWMLQRSTYVVAYIIHTWGGASKYVTKADRQGKIIKRII